jgi:hypothetical protein
MMISTCWNKNAQEQIKYRLETTNSRIRYDKPKKEKTSLKVTSQNGTDALV